MIQTNVTDTDSLRIIHRHVSIEIGEYQRQVLGLKQKRGAYAPIENESIVYMVKTTDTCYFASKTGKEWVLTDSFLNGKTWTFQERTAMTKFVKRNLM